MAMTPSTTPITGSAAANATNDCNIGALTRENIGAFSSAGLWETDASLGSTACLRSKITTPTSSRWMLRFQGGMTGDLSLMCPEFIQSFFAGLAASGAITSALRFVTKATFENSRDGLRKGAMFSSISCFFELLCVLLYAFIFPMLPIVKFYHSKAASEGSLTVTADLAAGGIRSHPNPSSEEDPASVERLNNKQLLMQNIDYALD